MKRRAQAALEFLTTYGWALLVILVMIGALVYFGLLSPSKALPNRCDVPPGFQCKDFQIKEDGLSVVMSNKMGEALKDMTIVAISSDADGATQSLNIGGDIITAAGICNVSKATVSADDQFEMNCTQPAASATYFGGLTGEKVKVEFTFQYTPSRATYPKTAQVTIYGPVV